MSGSKESTASQNTSLLALRLCRLADKILRDWGVFILLDFFIGEEHTIGDPGFDKLFDLGESEMLWPWVTSWSEWGLRFDNESNELLDSAVNEAARDVEKLWASQEEQIHVTLDLLMLL